MTDLAVALPNDAAGRYFDGVERRMPKGTVIDADYAVQHVLLVAADGITPLVTANGLYVQGPVAHDAAAAGNPLLLGGYASAAAPTGVSADGDAVRAWSLRNGARAVVLTAAGALIGGDAANGVDVDVTRASTDTLVGALTETAPATDTASSGLNGRLQRIAQRLTSLIALLPAALGAGGGLKVDGSGTALPVSTPYSAVVTLAHTTGSATTASSAMLASNAGRKYAIFINDGTVDVYLKVAATAVASQGIRLAANGGSYEMSAAFGNLATGAVNGITGSGSATVLVTEGT